MRKPFTLIMCIILLALPSIATAFEPTPSLITNVAESMQCVELNDANLCAINTDAGPLWLLFDGFYEAQVMEEFDTYWHVTQVSVSPDQSKLAVVSTAEGHPLLRIFEITGLSDGLKPELVDFVDPYPGGIWIEGWEKSVLLVKADVALDDEERGSEEAFESDRLYYYNPFRKIFSAERER